nr:UDP-glycosyltransferase 83A1-like [Tanacetum cinerariifolium]
MPSKLEELIKHINKTNDEKIACIIADYCMGWISKVAQKMSIRLATFCSGSAAFRSVFMSVQKLLDDQVIDSDGVPLRDQMIQLSTHMPSLDPKKFLWACVRDSTTNKILFDNMALEVIYVAFGSFAILNQPQFEELALGLELTNKPFLWVVRPGTSGSTEYVYPSGYMERIGTIRKIVSWAPQQEVLNHPSVACFMSHYGWNSTMEGVSNG